MTRIAYDTEFVESANRPGSPSLRQPTIDLVSIGLVDIDRPGRSYYAISAEFDVGEFWSRLWLVENVGRHLPWVPHTDVVLSWLWGPMVDLPDGIPMWTHDIRQYAEPLDAGRCLPAQRPGTEHHALRDAEHDADCVRALDEYFDIRRAGRSGT